MARRNARTGREDTTAAPLRACLTESGPASRRRPRRATHRALGLATSLFAISLLAAACDAGEEASVLLVTVDTLRADHLGAYGSTTTRTPSIDRLASEGTLFEHAHAPMALTRPSHFTVFTSRYPREHGVLNNAMALGDEALTIAEILAAEGYHTGAFVGVRLLGADSGIGQGFDVLDAPEETNLRPASEVVPAAIDWVSELPPEARFLLWVHLFDPHLPYAPPPEYQDDLDPGLARMLPSVDWLELRAIAAQNAGDVPARVFEHAKGLYRGDVEYTDHWIGRLLEGLPAERAEHTLVVFTADHGESFEHGVYFEHADSLHEGAVRIPLILRHPNWFDAGTRIRTQVSAVDVAPTILDCLGMDAPAGFSGRSLRDVADGEEHYALLQYPIYQERAARRRPEKQQDIRSVAGQPTKAILTDVERVGVVGRDWKYIRTGDEEELFRMSPTVDEGTNVADSEPEALEHMRAVLDRELERRPIHFANFGEVSEDMKRTLEDLGYVGGS